MALQKLYQENPNPDFDDRAATIEIQIEQSIKLQDDNLLGVVLPEEYMRTPGMRDAINKLTPNIETYPHYPLNLANFYALIYDCVNRIYKRAGVQI